MAIINDYVICKAFRVILQPGLQWIASSAFDGKTITRNNRMNMKGLYLILLSFLFGCNLPDMQTGKEVSYYFDQPAQIWEETLPLGNDRIGMMPDGGIERENVVLNEISLWSGSKQDTDNPYAYYSLANIRRLLFEGRNDEAQDLMYKTFVCKGTGVIWGRCERSVWELPIIRKSSAEIYVSE